MILCDVYLEFRLESFILFWYYSWTTTAHKIAWKHERGRMIFRDSNDVSKSPHKNSTRDIRIQMDIINLDNTNYSLLKHETLMGIFMTLWGVVPILTARHFRFMKIVQRLPFSWACFAHQKHRIINSWEHIRFEWMGIWTW